MTHTEELVPRKGPVSPIPMVTEDGLYLWDWGLFDELQKTLFIAPGPITRKFVKCFVQTCGQIPEQDRNTLIDFWGSRRPLQRDAKPTPAIEFNSFSLPVTMRAACRGGYELLFSVDFVERAKPLVLVHTIAHELGHAISYPHGWYKQHECTAHRGECVALRMPSVFVHGSVGVRSVL